MKSVFISYSRKDSEVAEYLYSRISGAGYSVWKDRHNIPLGGKFPKEITENIENSDCFLVILSESSLSSEWVDTEINMAMASGRRIIPIVIEDVQLPATLRSLHCLDMSDEKSRWKALHNLVDNLPEGSLVPRVYNMSGHKSIKADGVLVLDHCDFKLADLSNTETVVDKSVELASLALPYLTEAGVGIVPPGHSTLAVATLAYFLGVLNQMPKVFWTMRDNDGNFGICRENYVSLQDVRNQGFDLRATL